MIGQGINMPLYNHLRSYKSQYEEVAGRWMGPSIPLLPWNSIAGALAGNLSTSIVFPMEVWSTRWTTEVKKESKGIREMFRMGLQMVRERSMVQGLMFKLVSATPFNSIFGFSYPQYQRLFHQWLQPSPQSWWIQYQLLDFGAASTAALTTVAITHPLDTVVRRIQVARKAFPGAIVNGRSVLRMMYQQESHHSPFRLIRLLYAALVPNMLKCSFTYGLRFSSWGYLVKN
jgi:Mitochondrial carrier protein